MRDRLRACENVGDLVRHRFSWRRWALLAATLAFSPVSQAQTEQRAVIAGHVPHLDAAGPVLPWISWITALEREIPFHQQCPSDHGYPRALTETFLQRDG